MYEQWSHFVLDAYFVQDVRSKRTLSVHYNQNANANVIPKCTFQTYSKIEVMFGMHTLKNCVHCNQSVITIHSYLEMWCDCCYIWLITSHLKYDVNIVMYNWLHLIWNVIVIIFSWLHLIWNMILASKCNLLYHFSKCTSSLKQMHIASRMQIQMWCAKCIFQT